MNKQVCFFSSLLPRCSPASSQYSLTPPKRGSSSFPVAHRQTDGPAPSHCSLTVIPHTAPSHCSLECTRAVRLPSTRAAFLSLSLRRLHANRPPPRASLSTALCLKPGALGGSTPNAVGCIVGVEKAVRQHSLSRPRLPPAFNSTDYTTDYPPAFISTDYPLAFFSTDYPPCLFQYTLPRCLHQYRTHTLKQSTMRPMCRALFRA